MILTSLLTTATLLATPSPLPQTEQDPQSPAVSLNRTTARFALAQAPASWDPIAADVTANQVIQRQVYEGLFEYKPQAEPVEIQALLAKSWTIQADGLEWIIHLREDAYFHDPFDPPLWPERRRQVTAHDVVFSWLRMADGRLPSGGFWAMQGLFPGLDEFHRETRKSNPKAEEIWQRGLKQGVAGIQVVDKSTLKLRLHRPDPTLLVKLASPYFVVYPAEAVERSGDDFLNQPIGSGPYMLESWIPKHQAILKQTPAWRGQQHPGSEEIPGGWTMPQIPRLQFTLVAEGSTRVLQFKRGEIDRLTPLQAAFGELIVNGKPSGELQQRGVSLHRVAPAGISMIGFNMDDPDLGWVPGDEEGNQQRRLLRQAIASAYPYGQWHKVIRNNAWAVPARSFLPAGLPDVPRVPDCKFNHQDFDRARQLLAQAGWPGGRGAPTLRYELGGTDAVNAATGEMFKQAMAQVGLKVEVVANTWHDLRAKMNRREAQIFGRGWTMDWADAENILSMFYGPNQSPNINRSNFQSEAYDQLYRQMLVAPSQERETHIRSMLELLNEELPSIPVDHRIGFLLLQPWLQGSEVTAFDPFACKFYRLEH